MDCIKIADFIPAISILISIMTITIIVLLKYGDKIFDREYKASNILLLVIASLFFTILIVHLFKEQTWTADILKILVGTLIGAGSTKLSRKRSDSDSSIYNKGTIKGDVAGRDINKNIQNIESAISEIKDSVVHQNNKIEQIVGVNSDNDYVINTVYDRNQMCDGISRVIKFWHNKGWTLKHFCSDYNGMDGLFLIFEKPKRTKSDGIEVYFYRGSDTRYFEEYVQNYEL